MVGVIAKPAEEAAVREFFELFKTPWEFHRSNMPYDVVLSTGSTGADAIPARLLIVYGSGETAPDTSPKVKTNPPSSGVRLSFSGGVLPIYGRHATFSRQGEMVLEVEGSGEAAGLVDRSEGRVVARVGYDLFSEVKTLLTQGQPAENAGIPTLDLHIAFLRDLITGCGISLLEIPPAPAGYPFIACLTHDVDHPSIRGHKFDHTMFGFLYRATLGSAMQAARGRLSFHKLLKNWGAAARLPLMHLGLAKDIWYEFDRYLELEKGKPSTFFVIPFEGTPGQSANGKAPQMRATRYDVSHLREKIPSLLAAGCEVGLHGIDAWADASRGRVEAQRIAEFTGKSEVGVRMHWLYRDEQTPAKLDAAGFPYDSTAGYNETVGYWAGTAQVFRPLGNQQTLELPLHVMDTALFNRDRLGLTPAEAWNEVSPILANVGRHGGTFTVNWHDRSIAPERLWDDFHRDLVEKLEKKGPWFSTASQAVQWFRKRRSTKLEQIRSEDDGATGRIAASGGDSLPGLRLRWHQARPSLAAPSVFTETTPNDKGEFHLGK